MGGFFLRKKKTEKKTSFYYFALIIQMAKSNITDADRGTGADPILQRMLQERREKAVTLDNAVEWIERANKKTDEDLDKFTMANALK